MGVKHKFNEPFQQKPSIEMGLCHQKHCQLGLNGTEKQNRVKKGCQTSGILQDGTIELVSCKHELSFKKREEWN